MKKILLAIFSLIAIASEAQKNLPGIETLKRELQTLKANKRVDKANEIAATYGIMGQPKFLERADSIGRYANLALSEAVKANYKKGTGYAYLNLASAEKIRSTGLQISNQNVLPTAEKMLDHLLKSFQLANELKDVELLGDCSMLAASYPWSDSKLPGGKLKEINDKMNGNEPNILFRQAGNEKKEGEACTYMAQGASINGNYEKAFDYSQIAIRLNQKTLPLSKTKEEQKYRVWLCQQSLVDMADLYKAAGDFTTALGYLNRSEQYGRTYQTNWYLELEKAELFIQLGNYDSAFVFLNKRRSGFPDNAWTQLSLGQAFLAIRHTDSALYFLQQANSFFNRTNNPFYAAPALLDLGAAYIARKDLRTAYDYVSPVIAEAVGLNDKPRPLLMRGYELLSKIHHGLGNHDSAYYYLLKHVTLKDSLQSRQFLFRISAAKKEATIGLLEKDNMIKHQQLEQAASFKYFLLIALLLLIISGAFILRSFILKRKNDTLRSEQLENQLMVKHLEIENRQKEFQRKATDLEMQALRAQMNPHFIFNCLSSINKYILKNEPDTASDYLTRFSRLIRMVLINSQRSLITLEDELEMLTIYLDMERMRFKNTFNYNIIFSNRVDVGAIFIPPLLLQPFCENAIWHGLKHLADHESTNHEPGRLDIVFSMEDKVLNCNITDNGIGRKKAGDLNSKSAEDKKSLGLKITAERLALLNQEKNAFTSYEIEDLQDESGNATGTSVNLKISYKEALEEVIK